MPVTECHHQDGRDVRRTIGVGTLEMFKIRNLNNAPRNQLWFSGQLRIIEFFIKLRRQSLSFKL
ncbi:MAG TPA: hypothetical protein DIT97_10590 [Gimesia maris]|uniref:Uncharacterized protein n=1 Tax=Gimesia maris TaxID=122 RepID=A0A3D3R5W5_9PLAN|nr:hypothetical protein [Gimesia maris]